MTAQLLCSAILIISEAWALQDDGTARERPASVLLLVDASQGWYSNLADKIVHVFRTAPPAAKLQIALFDFESGAAAHSLDTNGDNVSTFDLPPRTPMREAMSACIERLSSAEIHGTLIVVAHEESYQSWISSRRLKDSAQSAEITIHSIHFASRETEDRPGFFRRMGRAIGSGVVWVFDRFNDEPGASHGETADLLKSLAEYTGGHTCEAPNEQSAVACAEQIRTNFAVSVRSKND
jgi:hypothetical protein